MENTLNKLLVRQIKKHFGSIENLPQAFHGIIEDISNTYANFEDDALLLENSIEISSQELRDAFLKQKQDAEAQKETIRKIKEAIDALNYASREKINESELTPSDSNYLFNSLIKLIEERKQAEEALQQSSKKWEAIISASPDGIGMVSLDGSLQLMSDKLAMMYGYSVEEKDHSLGKHILEFIDSSNHRLLSENIQNLLSGKNDHTITEYLAVKKDKTRFYVDVNSTVLLDSKGNPESILFVERDITERKQAQETLLNERTLFRTIIDLIPDAVYVKDSEGRKLLANPTEVHLAGKSSEEEIIGRTDFSLYPDTEATRAQEEDEIVLRTGQSVLDVDGTLIDKEGKQHWLLVSKVPLRDIHGKITGIVGIT
ncbi:MAG: PAS domain-containing protein, partial [Bacteroidota bacterium]